ncbi:SPRY domain-containing SOCS box protein 2 isoform X2 [Syngnathoides biaculeatus]|uniref:SPRY domain-containing SOCS box protein 2 isoform X2 n=1 Tax=Syngnathoides biaculeatus TaxID=300417 RepID=UPI002ADE6D5B|nr:SPRY domain-containing SOCS box protein 2 isoform X2 [Syngnathoides biaculeatus]
MGLSLSRWLRGEPRPSLSSAFRPVAVPMSSRLEVLLSASAVPPGDSRSRWSSVHRSPHFLLSAGGDEATRLPAELSSDGVRAEKGAKDGLHVWEVTWTAELRGSHAVLGVSGHRCPLRGSGYAVLLGSDSQSWGWELRTNRLWHDGQSRGAYPEKRRRACGANEAQAARLAGSSPDEPDGPPLRVPERILLVLDADAGTLGFVVDGHFLGAAFDGLPRGAELFPAATPRP